MNNANNHFLNDEMWLLTFLGGLSRTKTYKKNANKSRKTEFRATLREQIGNYEKDFSTLSPSDELHLEFLGTLTETGTKKFSDILSGNRLHFGVTQKIVNLRLKYLWCLGWINEPPHFPVDRIMLSKIYPSSVPNWTEMDEKTYLDAIGQARKLAKSQTLAQWELQEFERR